MTAVTAGELANDVHAFLRFRRAMGIPYRRGEIVLNGFVRFVAQHWGDQVEVALDEAITRWCTRIAGRKAVTLANEFGPVRQLCLFRRRRDPSSFVPEHALAPVKESVFLPYIFSRDEVDRILAAASSHRGRFIWALMLRTLILVVYCTGLRLGEAVRLRAGDVDLDHGVLTIQRSKGRTRIVAIRADLVAELRRYTADRERLKRDRRRADLDRFFLRRDGSPLTIAWRQVRSGGFCANSASSPQLAASAHARTSSATRSLCIGSRLGPMRAWMSRPGCRCCRRILATKTSSARRFI
jgi:integrase/recombinase XerD